MSQYNQKQDLESGTLHFELYQDHFAKESPWRFRGVVVDTDHKGRPSPRIVLVTWWAFETAQEAADGAVLFAGALGGFWEYNEDAQCVVRAA